MRHRVAGRKFDRNSGARKALLRNLVAQLFTHDRIVTTEAKAKEIRSIAEKLITKAKREDVHSRRQIMMVVNDRTIVKRLFDVILAKLSHKNTGGYTRITKLNNRKGDDAPLVLLEILEPDIKPPKGHKATKKKVKEKKEKVKPLQEVESAPKQEPETLETPAITPESVEEIPPPEKEAIESPGETGSVEPASEEAK